MLSRKITLKHRALVTIAVALWNRSDIRDLVSKVEIKEHHIFKIPTEWRYIISEVERKVSELPLPRKLKEEISDLVPPIGLEIKKWKEIYYYHTGYDLGRKPNKLCWTPQGTVDEKKTAELFVKDETLLITKRFRIACVYCLEEEIKELWNAMLQKEKDLFSIENSLSYVRFPLLMFWIYDMKGEATKFSDCGERIDGREITPYQRAFECSVSHHLKVAAEYFLQKLTPRERDESLVKCAADLAKKHFDVCVPLRLHEHPKVNNYADTLCFLLSQMNEEQQTKVIESEPAGVLSCLLYWPWQRSFMEMTNRVWDFLPRLKYPLLLILISSKMAYGFKDYNYHELLVEFWECSPSIFKKLFLGCPLLAGYFILHLFSVEDKKIIILVLKNASVKEKEDILFRIKNKIFPECTSNTLKGLLEKLIQFLSDIINNDNEKRSVEDGNSSPAKKFE